MVNNPPLSPFGKAVLPFGKGTSPFEKGGQEGDFWE